MKQDKIDLIHEWNLMLYKKIELYKDIISFLQSDSYFISTESERFTSKIEESIRDILVLIRISELNLHSKRVNSYFSLKRKFSKKWDNLDKEIVKILP